jgi:CheY-like chemotaxis protein
MKEDRQGGRQSDEPGFLNGREILVVDDEPDQLTYIGTLLEDNGATTLRANNGEQAIDLARRERPDLITLDLAMPGQSGAEVFEILRSDEDLHQIPICIITGRPELRRLIYETPGPTKPEGYLDKPINEELLLLTIRRILKIRRQ